MTTVQEAFVTLRPDTRGFGREAEGGIKSALSGVAKIAGGIITAQVFTNAAQGVKDFVGGSVTAASDLGESINAVQQIFAEAAPTILKWGENNATAFGLSQRAFNQLATPMGAQLKNLGFEQDAVAEHTINLTKRASDMASVFNTTVPDALEAINSALRGEANPIERYGVSVNQTAVNLRALADTGKTSAAQLTENEKAAARLALIFEQTDAVAGDFANTSDGLANSQRIQAAETEKYQAMIGEKLIPVQLAWNKAKFATVALIAERVIPALSSLSSWISDNVIPAVRDLASRFREDVLPVLRDDVMPVVQRFTTDVLGALVTTFQQDVQPRLETFGDFLRDTVLPAARDLGGFLQENVVPALQDFGSWLADHKDVLVAVGIAWATFTATTQTFAAIKGIQAAFSAMSMGIRGVNMSLLAPPGIAILLAAIATAIFLVWQNWDSIWPKLEAGWEWMKDKAGDLAEAVTGFFTDIWDGITSTVSRLGDWLRENWQAIVTGILAIVFPPAAGLFLLITNFDKVKDAIAGAADWLRDQVVGAFTALKDGAVEKFDVFVEWAGGIHEAIKNAVGDLSRLLWNIGSDIIGGLWGGMKDKWDRYVAPWLGTIGGVIQSIKGPIEEDRKLLVNEGSAIIEGLGSGMERAWPGVARLLGDMTSSIPEVTAPRAGGGLSAPAPPVVNVTFADGMGWLREFVTVSVGEVNERELTRGNRLAGGRA